MFVLAAFLAVVIGLSLGLLGGGGSILTVPFFVYVLGVSDKSAVASSLLVVSITSAAAAIPYALEKQIYGRTALIFASTAMVSAFAGGMAARQIPGPVILVLFAVLMLTTAGFMWRGRRADPATDRAHELQVSKILVVGLAVGFVTGLVGAGGGFLVVPALALLGGIPLRSAVGTSLVIIALNSAAGFLGYVTHVDVAYAQVGWVILASVAGALLGSRLSRHVPPARLRKGFALLVLVMGAFVLWRELGSVLSPKSTAGVNQASDPSS